MGKPNISAHALDRGCFDHDYRRNVRLQINNPNLRKGKPMEDDDILKAAIITHETNRAWCAMCGDFSQERWDRSPKWQRDSAIDGVKFHIENPEAGDSASHENWMNAKIGDGWVYGDVKDPDAKTHPCIVPFDELPKEQQIKDALFRSVVHAILG